MGGLESRYQGMMWTQRFCVVTNMSSPTGHMTWTLNKERCL